MNARQFWKEIKREWIEYGIHIFWFYPLLTVVMIFVLISGVSGKYSDKHPPDNI